MVRDISMSLYTNEKTNSKGKFKIWVYSLKKNGLSVLFCVFTICLVLFSRSNLTAAKNGLILWATAVVPSLFPFFVANEMLSYTNVISILGKLLTPIMRPLFGVPGEAAYAFIMGLISGYPVGAKIISNFMEQGICTKEEAERMLSFTNNSGPLFIIGTVGISLFSNTAIGILLFITHILACVSVGIILNLFATRKRSNNFIPNERSYSSLDGTNTYDKLKRNHTRIQETHANPRVNHTNHYVSSLASQSSNPSFSSLGEILGNSIKNATSTILMIGGFVVVFSVIISILNQSHILNGISSILSPVLSSIGIPDELVKPLLSGIVELTNGVSLVAATPMKNVSINIILCAFLLGFGGISVLLQVFSIVSKCGLSIKKYALGKLLQGLLAAFYTMLALQFIPFLQFNL